MVWIGMMNIVWHDSTYLMVSCYVQAGDSADLVCSYYLDSHQLYSVKWYKV